MVFGWPNSIEDTSELKGLRAAYADRLESGKPIEPQKKRPHSIKGEWLVDENDERLYQTFSSFDAQFNLLHNDGLMRLQQQGTASHSIFGQEDPSFGPCYDLFFADLRTGRVEVASSIGEEGEFATVLACEVDNASLMPYDDVYAVLSTLRTYAAFSNDAREVLSVERAITRCLWEQVRTPDFLVTLDFRCSGHYRHFHDYVAQREAT